VNRRAQLRVGIDGRSFGSPAAGVRRYVRELTQALVAASSDIELVALGGGPQALPVGMRHVAEGRHPPTNLGWTAVGLPRVAARAGVDLIHAPAYTAPFVSALPVVLTIHDVSYARHPEWYPYSRDWLRRAFYRRSARGASHVLTDSEFSRHEIEAAYRIPGDRISVVPLGVTDEFRSSSDPLPTNVSRPFLLHVGDLHERRNLERVVAALAERHRRGAAPLTLVLAGVDRGMNERLVSAAAASGIGSAIVTLGPVPESGLRALYRDAMALVYPSRYEGFGLPLLEAMASGTPVLASRAASIPEVVGDAAVLLDPDDTMSWADAIECVSSDEGLRLRLISAGRTRAAEFTWARTARMTADVYRRVAARSS